MKFIESIADMIGPKIVPKEIVHNGVTRTFYFRQVSGEEADTLLVGMIDLESGKVDRTKMKGNAGRELAIALVDADGNQLATAEEINSLPAGLRSKLEAALKQVTGVQSEKKDLPDASSSGSTLPQSSEAPSES